MTKQLLDYLHKKSQNNYKFFILGVLVFIKTESNLPLFSKDCLIIFTYFLKQKQNQISQIHQIFKDQEFPNCKLPCTYINTCFYKTIINMYLHVHLPYFYNLTDA